MTLPPPTTPAGRRGLAALLDDPAATLLALDFDGTLAPVVADPTQARADPDALAALNRLGQWLGCVAVLTGRPARTTLEYGGFADQSALRNVVILGHYGEQRWDAETGEVTAPPVPAGVALARNGLPGLLRSVGAPDGTHIEDKGRALAVHTRQAADPDAALKLLDEPLRSLAARVGLEVEPGRMVLELRAPGVDKGAALARLVNERGAHAVLYAGDDLGDVPAFDTVCTLRSRGVVDGLSVYCAAATGESALPELASRADLTVPGPSGLAALLHDLADRLDATAHRAR